MRILVIRPGALGDVLLTLPALRLLQMHRPEATITLMAAPGSGALARDFGFVAHTVALEQAGFSTFFGHERLDERLGEYFGRFDWIISYFADPEGVLAGNLRRCVDEVLAIPPQPPDRVHAAEHLARPIADRVGVKEIPRVALEVPERHHHAAATFLARAGGREARLIGIHPGSGSRKKNWPLESFAALARQLRSRGFRPVVVTGLVEEDRGEAIDEAFRTCDPIRAHDLELGLLAGLLAKCEGYVGNDSGVTHLAAMVGTPTVAIFGSTDPAVWAPRGRHVTVLGGEAPPPSPAQVLAALTAILSTSAA